MTSTSTILALAALNAEFGQVSGCDDTRSGFAQASCQLSELLGNFLLVVVGYNFVD
jgi:hypothetical protein